MQTSPNKWLVTRPAGLYCEPGQFYLDPIHPVDYALISHAHADHARARNQHVLAFQMKNFIN